MTGPLAKALELAKTLPQMPTRDQAIDMLAKVLAAGEYTKRRKQNDVVELEALAPEEREIARLVASVPLIANFGGYGMPRTDWELARWSGAEPAGVLESKAPSGGARWRVLREGLEKAEAWPSLSARAFEGLSASERFHLIADIARNAYMLDAMMAKGRGRIAAADLEASLDATGKDAGDVAHRYLEEMRDHGVASNINKACLAPLLLASVKGGHTIDPAFHDQIAFSSELAPVIESMPMAAREEMVLARLGRLSKPLLEGFVKEIAALGDLLVSVHILSAARERATAVGAGDAVLERIDALAARSSS